jgi:hypothetical protein
MKQLQRRTCQVRPPEHLEEWAAQKQREIMRFLEVCWYGHKLPSLSIWLYRTGLRVLFTHRRRKSASYFASM